MRNYAARPIELEVRRTFPGHVECRATVKAGQKRDLLYGVVRHQGRNARQSDAT